MTDHPQTQFVQLSPEDSSKLMAKLGRPFVKSAIRQRHEITCRRCRWDDRGHCDSHAWADCDVCGVSHTSAATHVDYVGHAHVTERLLKVDPTWTWEPLATNEHGLPVVEEGVLWIRIRILGIWRIEVGEGSTMKERIANAIRRGAMRAGVGLSLWKDSVPTPDTTPRVEAPRPDRERASRVLAAGEDSQ